MYSSEDFERFYIRYKAEAMPRGESIQHYCDRNGVPFNLFDKWYKDTRKRIVPVSVEGRPSEPAAAESVSAKTETRRSDSGDSVKITVDIKTTNGLHIQRRGLSYGDLVGFVGKLEALC